MEEKTSYAKSQLTKALLELLKKKNMNEISVSELCDTAGLSRLSYYRNYTSKEEILEEYLHGITTSFLKGTSVNFRTTPQKEFIIHLITHMQEQKDVVNMLVQNNLSYLLKEAFDEAFLRSVDIYQDPYRCYVASGAYFNLVYAWFINGCKESAEEVSEMDLTI
ncbi:MAG: TetR/AcrR family transcriptional regulator [Erysipelotrichaceae bacterium]|nr:TetR/AcrR family transcriptional regulator [Erysipelotrichaceae bacterium]